MKASNVSFFVLVVGLVSHSVIAADPVSINISGTVVASPCTVDTLGSTLSAVIPDTQAGNLSTAGSMSDYVPLKIVLNKCPASTTKVSVTFSGTADADYPRSFKNTGTATNVSVLLKYGALAWGNPVYAGSTWPFDIDSTSHSVTIDLWAREYATKTGVMPGTVNAAIVASFVYQ